MHHKSLLMHLKPSLGEGYFHGEHLFKRKKKVKLALIMLLEMMPLMGWEIRQNTNDPGL